MSVAMRSMPFVIAPGLLLTLVACGGPPSFEVTAEEVDVDLVDTPTDDVTDGGRLLHRR